MKLLYDLNALQLQYEELAKIMFLDGIVMESLVAYISEQNSMANKQNPALAKRAPAMRDTRPVGVDTENPDDKTLLDPEVDLDSTDHEADSFKASSRYLCQLYRGRRQQALKRGSHLEALRCMAVLSINQLYFEKKGGSHIFSFASNKESQKRFERIKSQK